MTDKSAAVATRDIVDAIDRLYRQRLGRQGALPLHEPEFRGNEWAYLKDCIDTGWVSSAGAFVDRFERMIAQRCGAAFAIATANATVGLHATLHALGVGHGDLVVCPAISFVATANAICHCGATPLFIDVDAGRLGLDPASLQQFLATECEPVAGGLRHVASKRRVAAVVVVHVFGHPAPIERLVAICAAHGVPLIEDAAEALGSTQGGRACGTFGKAGVLSFNGNKIITTGGGGAILTDDPVLARRLKHLTTTARVADGWDFDHDEVGFNYRLPNLNAALGCAQLERLDDMLARKRRLAATISDALGATAGLATLTEPAGAASNYWLNAIVLDDPALRAPVLAQSNARGLQCRPCWRLLPDLPMFQAAPVAQSGLAVARDRVGRVINLPSSAALVDE